MYHVVHGPPAGTPYPELWVPPRRFAEHMFMLRRHGYRGVTLDQVWQAWHGGPGLPAKPVVVSFDDGYLSQYQHAAKTLKALRWPGVLNLEVKNLGLAGGLTRRQLGAMARDGWEIDAHTITHPDLTTVGAAQLKRETAGARSILRQRLHLPVRFFCYPAGRFDATAEAAVKAAGYRGATTELPGAARPGGDPYALPRVRVNGSDTGTALLTRLQTLH
jgi:peptidoglycan/xylan/chitin deacetylase (PgdA/CDA1 family)